MQTVLIFFAILILICLSQLPLIWSGFSHCRKRIWSKCCRREVGPVQCAINWINCLRSGVRSKVKVEAGNFLKSNLKEADVVFAYLTSEFGEHLEEKLLRELKSDAKVVTIAFEFPNWEPYLFDREGLIRVYKK